MSDYDVTLKVEDFVEVEYNGERYAREVKLIGEEDVCRFLYYTGTLLKTGCGLHRHFFFTNIPMCLENCAHRNLLAQGIEFQI